MAMEGNAVCVVVFSTGENAVGTMVEIFPEKKVCVFHQRIWPYFVLFEIMVDRLIYVGKKMQR